MLLGPPGSGKGTQAARITSRPVWLHLSTGGLFRDHLRRRTELGALARGYIDRGELVPDRVTVDIVRQCLRDVPRETRVLFDGFPRTRAQAVALDALLAELGRKLSSVVQLDVPREVLLARIAGRATCARCQTVYNITTQPPKVPGVCDRCGGEVAVRSDEAPEVVAHRLDVYERDTAPLAEYYRERGMLVRVDGNGSPEAVASRVAAAVR